MEIEALQSILMDEFTGLVPYIVLTLQHLCHFVIFFL